MKVRKFDVIFKGILNTEKYAEILRLQEDYYLQISNFEALLQKIKVSRVILNRLFRNKDICFCFGTAHGIKRTLEYLEYTENPTVVTTTLEHSSILSPINGILKEYWANRKKLMIIPIKILSDDHELEVDISSLEEEDLRNAVFIYSTVTYNYGLCLYKIKEIKQICRMVDWIVLDEAHSFLNVPLLEMLKPRYNFRVFDTYKWFPGLPGMGIIIFKKVDDEFYNHMADIFQAIPDIRLQKIVKQKNRQFHEEDLSWRFNPLLTVWAYNSELLIKLLKASGSYKKIVNGNIKLAKLFDDLFSDLKLDNFFTKTGSFGIRSILSDKLNLQKLNDFLRHRGIIVHYIPERKINELGLEYPCALRFCFNSFLINEDDVIILAKTLSNAIKRVGR